MKEASLFLLLVWDFKDEAVILRDGLFAVQIFWKSVFHNMGNVPLDQRLRVSQEIIADIGTVFRDPLSRYLLFLIADQIDILENWMNFIYSVTMFYA